MVLYVVVVHCEATMRNVNRYGSGIPYVIVWVAACVVLLSIIMYMKS